MRRIAASPTLARIILSLLSWILPTAGPTGGPTVGSETPSRRRSQSTWTWGTQAQVHYFRRDESTTNAGSRGHLFSTVCYKNGVYSCSSYIRRSSKFAYLPPPEDFVISQQPLRFTLLFFGYITINIIKIIL
jgi:hypothetical protein